MTLRELIQPAAIVADLAATDRNGAIRELVGALAEAGQIERGAADAMAKAVINRERSRGTSGFGKGMALPHAKVEGIKKVVCAVGRSVAGVDFSAADAQPVHGIFLVISPTDKPEVHLAAMDTIFQKLHLEKFRKFLRQSDTREKIYELLKEADDKLLT